MDGASLVELVRLGGGTMAGDDADDDAEFLGGGGGGVWGVATVLVCFACPAFPPELPGNDEDDEEGDTRVTVLFEADAKVSTFTKHTGLRNLTAKVAGKKTSTALLLGGRCRSIRAVVPATVVISALMVVIAWPRQVLRKRSVDIPWPF